MAMRDNPQGAREFFDCIGKTAVYYNRSVGDGVFETYYDMLCDFEIEDVKQALRDHMRDPLEGRFFPTVAHICAHMEKRNPNTAHLSSDEAWSIACEAADEHSTVVWTQPIASAWGVAREIMPDRVGARMAFKAAYERAMLQMPEGAQPRWFPSLGADPARREDAIRQAVDQGRLTREHAAGLLPPPKPTSESKEIAAQYLSQLRLLIGKKS